MSHIEQEPVSASGADDLDCNSLGVGSLSISAVEADEDAYDPKPSAAGNIIKPFLARNCPEFVELSEVRERGWESQDGYKFFKKQRQRADNPSKKTAECFFDMMKKIGHEMHADTGVLRIRNKASSRPQILDMGLAPGGFLSVALDRNRDAQAFGFTLPISKGGYGSHVPTGPDVVIKFLDVTMLAADLGIDDIPEESPDGREFLPRQFAPDQTFDLVICSGSVVRNQGVARDREPRRLTTSQLALGLERLSPGGSMVVLFHKVEAWDTVLQLYRFDRFSEKMRLYKPATGAGHDKRSSFYMVAMGVRSRDPEALQAIESWKELWKAATFDVDGTLTMAVRDKEPPVEMVLAEFGDKLVGMGRKIWSIQAEALKKAPFIKYH